MALAIELAHLLPVPGGPIARFFGFLFANKSATLSITVPSLPLEVINTARKVEPDDSIFWAVSLSFLLS